MATKFMNLDLPVPGVTKGPTWATMINDVFVAIDEHDHSSGKGKLIDSSYIDVTGAIDFGDVNGVKNCKFFQFTDISSTAGVPGFPGALFNWKGDLWWQYDTTGGTGTGAFCQITNYDAVFSRSCSFEPLYINTATYVINYLEKVSGIFVTSQPTTITLPFAADPYTGRYYLFQDVAGNASTNNITITPQSTDTIGAGSAGVSHVINTDYGSLWIVNYTTGNSWIILNSN